TVIEQRGAAGGGFHSRRWQCNEGPRGGGRAHPAGPRDYERPPYFTSECHNANEEVPMSLFPKPLNALVKHIRGRRSPAPRDRRARPQVEGLEDRLCPALTPLSGPLSALSLGGPAPVLAGHASSLVSQAPALVLHAPSLVSHGPAVLSH